MLTDILLSIENRLENQINNKPVFNIGDAVNTNTFLGSSPIYKKMIIVDPLCNNGRINTTHIIENLGTILNFNCIVKNNSNGNCYDAAAIKKELTIEFSCTVTPVLISLAMNGDLTGYSALVTIEYTVD